MIVVFFAKSSHVAFVPLQERKTVNAEWYVNIGLLKVFESWCARRPNTGTQDLLLQHDHSSAHTPAATPDYLEANHVQLVTKTPHSQGLAPCDFFLYPHLVKPRLKGKQFQGARAIFEGVMSDMPQSMWSGAMVSWFERTSKFVHAEGDYFEKLDQERDP